MLAADLVKRLRKEAGYSARTFGDAIGVTGRNVRRYEAGEVEPPLSTAGLMARALGIPLDSLYVHEGDSPTPDAACALPGDTKAPDLDPSGSSRVDGIKAGAR